MAEKDVEMNESQDSKSNVQTQLQEEYLKSLESLEEGQLVEGEVIQVTSDQVFLDVGLKSEGKNISEEDLHNKALEELESVEDDGDEKLINLDLIILPAIIYMLIFNYYPMTGIQLAFKDWRIMKGIWGSPWATTNGELDIFKHFKIVIF